MSVTSNEVRKNLKQQQDEEEQSNYSFRLGYLQLQYLQIKCFTFKIVRPSMESYIRASSMYFASKRNSGPAICLRNMFKQGTSEKFD